MLFFSFLSLVSSTKKVTGVQTTYFSAQAGETDYQIIICFMEDLKNNNIPCQAIFFKDVAAGSQSSLKVENTVFSKISASYGCVLTVENYDLVITLEETEKTSRRN